MKRCKKALALLLVLLPAFVFSGCWDYHEVENYNMVAGFAIDRGQSGYKYHLTFECMMLQGDQKSGGVKPLIIETDGNTIFDAVRSALRQSSRKLYFSHCKIVVVSSDLASEGLLPILDWLQRDGEPRITVQLLISKEKTAGEILTQLPQSDQLISFQISKALDETTEYQASESTVRLFEVNNVLNSQGRSLVLPAIALKKDGSATVPELTGNAVFTGDRLVGWLDLAESEYLMFTLGKVPGGLLITGLNPSDRDIALEILSSSTSVKPVVSGDSVTVNIRVTVVAAYGEQNTRQNLLDMYPISKIETAAAQTLQNGIENVVATVQQKYSSDIFGFGDEIYQNDPHDWNGLRYDWNQRFKSVRCNVTAKVMIKNTASVPGKEVT